MLTLVRIPRSNRSAGDMAELIADYTVFARRRSARRHYIRAYGGFAIIVLLGAVFQFVPRREAMIAAAIFATPPTVLAAVQACYRCRLVRKMRAVRAVVQQAQA